MRLFTLHKMGSVSYCLFCPGLKQKFRILLSFFLLIVFANKVQAQSEINVKGTVTQQNGEPIVGASVIIKGSKKGVATQADGSFEIQAAPNETVVITHTGFVGQEIKLSGNNYSNISVRLIEAKNSLDEVVVVGYGTRKKSDVTGAITSISEQAIKDVPASNLASALQGQGAGIDIQRSGANSKPGATPNILIRGSRSLGASNSPLIVVDGIPFNGSITDLNQDDVASVEILKDASSTAIYGSRGANGVILVTSKKGKSGKPVMTYSGYVGQTRLIREFPVMNAEEFTLLKKWANINGNPGKYTGLDDPLFLTNGVFDPAEVEGLKTGRNTDWQSYIYKTGIMTDHQLGISGGTDITQYAVSGGFFNQTGIYEGQKFERYTVKASVDQLLGKRFKVGLNSLNTYSIRGGESFNPMAQALRASPLVSPFDSTGKVVNDYVPGSASQVWNPLGDLIPGAIAEERKRFGTFTTLYIDVNLFKGLKYRFNSGVEIRNDLYNSYFSGKTSYRVNQGGAAASNRSNFNTNYTLENLITYDETFAKKHKVNFTGLYSIQESRTTGNQFDYNISSDYLSFYNPVYSSNLKGTGTYSKWDILSYMGRINYSFDDRYLVTLTMRSDGSSRLAPGNKWHTFSSAAAAWNITRESFFSGITDKISNLKLRASYGTVGNTAINPYQTLGALSPLVYNFGSSTTTGAYFSNASNDSLTWENTSTANIGLDFGLFRNRISGSIEVYKQYTSSLLLPQTLPITSGIPNAIVKNIGKTENKGLEIHISSVNIQGRGKNNFSWSSDFNFFINRGKITQLANGATRDVANGWFVGEPIDVYYDFQKVGIWQNTPEDSAEAKRLGLTVTGSGSVIGTIRVADLSGPQGKPDGKIDATYDRIIVGTAEPKWEAGTTQRFSFKGFDLTVVAFARWGYTLNSSLYGGNFVNTYQGIYNNLKTDFWTPFNHQNENPKPNSGSTNPLNRSVLSYFDGSFIKIRSISLGYNLPSSIIKKIGGRSLRVYAIATDPFILFSPYRKIGGIDPEGAGTVGIDTPPVWSMTFGLNLSF
jgi:TonB-linked SusC/RagA family outer membrane protein